MLVIEIICTIFGALIFAMPIMYPNVEIKDTNRGEK